MAGYSYGKKAVFGPASNTTPDNPTYPLSGTAVVIGTYNTVSGSSDMNLIVGSGNTIYEDCFGNIVHGKSSTAQSGSEYCGNIGTQQCHFYSGSSYSGIIGGLLNNNGSSGTMVRSVILGGLLNVMNSTTNAVIAGGQSNSNTAADSSIIAGSGNTAGTGLEKSWCFGTNNTATDASSRVGFLSHNGTASDDANYALMTGMYPKGGVELGHVHGGGRLNSIAGSVQFTDFLLAVQTTDGVQATLVTQGGGDFKLKIPTDSTCMFNIDIVARRLSTQTESAAYNIKGCIRNDATAVSLVGSITVDEIAEDTLAWTVTAVPNNTDKTLDVKVTGEAAKTINWVASGRMTETNGA